MHIAMITFLTHNRCVFSFRRQSCHEKMGAKELNAAQQVNEHYIFFSFCLAAKDASLPMKVNQRRKAKC